MSDQNIDNIRQNIFDLAYKFYEASYPKKPFTPGVDYIPVSGKVIDSS